MNRNLERLRELTEVLPAPLLITMSHLSEGFVEYDVEGTCVGFPLYNVRDVAVQRAFVSAGSAFPNHEHETHEFLVVYTGRLVVTLDDMEYPLGVADCIHIEPYTPHSVSATEDTWLLGITVPSEEGYPHYARSE